MNKKIFLLGIVLLLIGRLSAAEVPCLVTVSADGTKNAYALTGVQRIQIAISPALTLDPGIDYLPATMTVKRKSAADVTRITCISFAVTEPSGITNTQAASVFVFPNPVQSTLTINGVDADSKIDLYSVTGALVQSIFAQENAIDVDVSSLPQGTYMLRVGEQTIKFVKQ